MHFELAIADDHRLFTKSLEMMLNSFDNFTVTLEAHSGAELQQKLSVIERLPDILLLDVSMPDMSGVEIAEWVATHYPSIKVAAVTMNDDEKHILAMLKAGCCSYLLKDIHPAELEKGLLEIAQKGYYNSDRANTNYRRLLQAQEEEMLLTQREREFLTLASSDDTYKNIASKMKVAMRTVDGYRDNIFKKFNVESRTGMVLEGVKRGIIKL